MRNRQMGALRNRHALPHEAVLGRIVKRLAFRAHCFVGFLTKLILEQIPVMWTLFCGSGFLF
jgi:hypothetical protein